MKKNFRLNKKGFTLIELMIVVTIMSILASIAIPKFLQLTTKAYQASGKGNLGTLRSTLSIYYSEQEGSYPLRNVANGAVASLSSVLVPKYMAKVPVPQIHDGVAGHNGLSSSFDSDAVSEMAAGREVYIDQTGPEATVGIHSPYGFDNTSGIIFFTDDNLDTVNQSIYLW